MLMLILYSSTSLLFNELTSEKPMMLRQTKMHDDEALQDSQLSKLHT